jgi:hypothetical protein
MGQECLDPGKIKVIFTRMANKIAATIGRLAETATTVNDPLERVRAAKQLRELAHQLERDCGKAARDAGVTLVALGEIYGASKQAMMQRFGRG